MRVRSTLDLPLIIFRRTLFVFVLLGTLSFAWSRAFTDELTSVSDLGSVDFFVFDGGKPLSGVRISVGSSEACSSDEAGLCQLQAPFGTYWLQKLQGDGFQMASEVVPGGGGGAIQVSAKGAVSVYIDLALARAGVPERTQEIEGESRSEKTNTQQEAVAGANPLLTFSEPFYRVDAALGTGKGPDSERQSGKSVPLGELKLRVRSVSSGRSISGAQVFIKGMDFQARTDAMGEVSFQLPAGGYDLAFVHPDYSSLTLRDVSLESDLSRDEAVGEPSEEAAEADPQETTTDSGALTEVRLAKRGFQRRVDVELSPVSIALEELVVSAPHVRGSAAAFNEIRKESLVVNDVIGAEQMSRNGDSSAASALRRVTGLTLLDGKYIYVRGLGERYSSVTLNGSFLPSPEPMRRVVPLDIFPASVLEGIVVQKTFTPDMPGEFGGGTLRLRTRRNLEGNILKFSYGKSYDLQSEPRLRGPSGGRDWTGFDDGTRALPDAVRKADRGPIVDGGEYSDQELESFGESFKNAYSLSKQNPSIVNLKEPLSSRLLIGEQQSLSTEMRVSGSFGIFQLGASLSGLYKTGYDDGSRKLKRYNADSGKLTSLDKDLHYQYSKRKIDVGSLGHLRLGVGESHSIEAISLLTRKSTDTAQVKQGMTGSGDDTIRSTGIEWNERELYFSQFLGSHEFLRRLIFDWRYSLSDARNYIPDSRSYRYELRGDEYLISSRGDGNARTFSTLVDLAEDWGVDATLALTDSGPLVFKTRAGVSSFYKRREYEARRFYFRVPDAVDPSLLAKTPEEIFSSENISASGFTLLETTRPTDSYQGRQILDAAYGQAELSIGELVSVVAGVRVEESKQEVLTYSLHDPSQSPTVASLKDESFLPGTNLTLRVGPFVQLRGAYSETVSRPDLRELSPGSYYDDRLDIEVEGYPDLKNSRIRNIDARVELYSGRVNRLSLGVFRKDILRPIERILLNVAGNDTKISYRNSKSARNEGVEVEFALGAGDFVTTGNLAYIDSKMTLDLSEIGNQVFLSSTQRAMQGVSPYILNFGLAYEPETSPFRANLVYNQIGPLITELGTNGVPDVYEDSKWTLDFVASMKFDDVLSVGLKFSDIIPQGTTTRQDGKVILDEPGVSSVSWSVAATF